ncbi:MAG: hypothetical protein HFJ42_01040 [Clostridia bacterium]|nr:hypothetical protein [Clostridia bacterium]
MNKKRIIIIICIILAISLVYIAFVNIYQEKKETENVGSYSEIYYMSKEKEVIETVENTTIQGVVELNHNGYIYIFNGQHFGEYGFEMEEYTRANIDNKNQECIDYYTLEKYDTSYIQEGDIIICTGNLKKFNYRNSDFDTKENDIMVLKKDDFNTMKQKVFESENPVITVEDVFIFDKEDDVTPSIASHLYLKYDIEDNTNSDIVHHFPFGEKVYVTDETEIKGNLQKGKKVKVEYDYSDEESNNAKYVDERVKLKSIEVIEK